MNELVVGIDVGQNSVGLAALTVNDDGTPTELLNSVVVTHDAGVDPNQAKSATTRLSTSGTARRTRRLYRRRKRRLEALDSHIRELGWPIVNLESLTDPYFPWKVRAELATEKLEGESLDTALSIAVRHMARHRGWRNPYAKVESLFKTVPASDEFKALKERVTEQTGVIHDEDATPAQVVSELGFDNEFRLRAAPSTKYKAGAKLAGESVSGQPKDGILGGKLIQTDNAAELRKIGQVQGLSDDLVKNLIRWVFDSKSPKGSAERHVKRDSLPGQGKYLRAPKAHPEFQRYRIIALITNLRINESGVERPLNSMEQHTVIDYLMTVPSTQSPTWLDVAEKLGIDRRTLSGTATPSPDGDRPSSKPQVNVTNQRILDSKIKKVVAWWKGTNSSAQAGLVSILSNAGEVQEDDPGVQEALDLITSLDETETEKLHNISLPAGRAAYSVESLTRLSDRMLIDSVDLHEARKREFGVDDSWTPPADPIGEPVGNPAVDRVTKIVARWLMAVEREWGIPSVINIEHVRDGFSSQAMSLEYEREANQRNRRNQAIVKEAHEQLGIRQDMRPSDITRYLAVRRQGCQCVYCGDTISYMDCEMDHIVPRKGPGSNNRRTNLVATCIRCNRAKSNIPFAVWASNSTIPGVSVDEAVHRVKGWINDQGLSPVANRHFKQDVIARLQKTTEDDALDERSMESVAWMARELRHRIHYHFTSKGANTEVGVFQGRITSEARKASGLEDKVRLIGGGGKTRLDRRHHAMDAVTIALMRPSVAQTLAERIALREEQHHTRKDTGWKTHKGSFASRQIFDQWMANMEVLTELFNEALDNDKIPVMRNFRLRLGNSQAHDATINKLAHRKVGDEWSLEQIDRASTPALWCALTRHPDFDEQAGLPENPERSIRVHDKWYSGNETVEYFPTPSAALKVRGGWVALTDSIHHIRMYRIEGKNPSYSFIRVYSADLMKYRSSDLFSAPLKPQSISLRTTPGKLRKAIREGTATYLGWVVVGDELVFDIDQNQRSFKTGAIGELLGEFPNISSWQVDGFPDPGKLRLRPTLIAGEGIDSLKIKGREFNKGTEDILLGRGWRVSINVLLKAAQVHVVRRNSLGQERISSTSNLPTSYLIGD